MEKNTFIILFSKISFGKVYKKCTFGWHYIVLYCPEVWLTFLFGWHYTLFFIRTSKIQLRLWMFLGFCNLGIFNVLKIFCKNKAKSSYVLNFYQFLGLLFFQVFLEIHTRNRGHSRSNKESFGGTWSKISLRINIYCHFWEF